MQDLDFDIDVDLWNGSRSDANMPMEIRKLAMVMFVSSLTVCEIFTVKMCKTLTLTFRLGQGQIKSARLKAGCDLYLLALFDVDINF